MSTPGPGLTSMLWILVAALTWTVSIWLIWRLVKTGADEDTRRQSLINHLEELAEHGWEWEIRWRDPKDVA